MRWFFWVFRKNGVGHQAGRHEAVLEVATEEPCGTGAARPAVTPYLLWVDGGDDAVLKEKLRTGKGRKIP